MDRERLFAHLEQYYYPKKDILNRLPLGIPLEGFWQELLNRRMGRRTLLPLHSVSGDPYWYVVTDRMIAASERIIEELMVNEMPYDPYRKNTSVCSLEEVYYTTYVEGAMISMQDAMTFLQGDEEPRDINEQMILNNRQASSYIAGNLYHPVDEQFICTLAKILTERMDNGGDHYRTSDTHEIPSMAKERYTVPSAASIPDKMREVIRFLQDTAVHPLIKAGIAQAWILLVRPFAEGNERLARLLSTVILLRAGYSFFGEVSLSAIIARQSYEYYNATANILRAENGDDLTYFLEYFLSLLVRALEERKVRIAQRLAREQEEERMMAMQPIGRSAEADVGSESHDTDRGAFSPKVDRSGDDKSEKRTRLSPRQSMKGGDDEAFIREQLRAIKDAETLMSPVAEVLEEFMNKGITRFTRYQVTEKLDYTEKQVESIFRRLKDKGIIFASHRDDRRMVYGFTHVRDQSQGGHGYSRELIEKIEELANSEISAKDKRIGNLLMEKLTVGVIRLNDYEQRGWASRWPTDMRLAGQLGLVEKINPDEFRIRSVPVENYALLPHSQKAMASAMFRAFGEDVFSLDMVAATLEYSFSHASAVLHLFTLLRILMCKKEDVNRYQFLVTPKEHPECFAA